MTLSSRNIGLHLKSEKWTKQKLKSEFQLYLGSDRARRAPWCPAHSETCPEVTPDDWRCPSEGGRARCQSHTSHRWPAPESRAAPRGWPAPPPSGCRGSSPSNGWFSSMEREEQQKTFTLVLKKGGAKKWWKDVLSQTRGRWISFNKSKVAINIQLYTSRWQFCLFTVATLWQPSEYSLESLKPQNQKSKQWESILQFVKRKIKWMNGMNKLWSMHDVLWFVTYNVWCEQEDRDPNMQPHSGQVSSK